MDRVVKMTMTVKMADERQRHTRLQEEKNKTMQEIIRQCGGYRNKMKKIMKRRKNVIKTKKKQRQKNTSDTELLMKKKEMRDETKQRERKGIEKAAMETEIE